MKKLFLLTLAMVITFILVSCGGETTIPIALSKPSESSKPSEAVTMVDITTEDGISLKLPSDMAKQDNGAYINSATLDIAMMQVLQASEMPYSKWKQEDYTASELEGRQDLVVESFENDIQINGKDALICKSAFTTEGGTSVVTTMVLVTDGISEYIISLMYSSDNTDGSLAKNLQACIDSINMKVQ